MHRSFFAPSNRQRGAFQYLRRPAFGSSQRLSFRNHVIHKPKCLTLFGIDSAAGQQHPHGLLHPNLSWQAMDATSKTDDELWKDSGKAFAGIVGTEDFKEGPKAFIEKRAPVWKGR